MKEITEILGEGKFVRLLRRGKQEIAERVGARGAVLIVATTKDGEIILVRQWREAVRAYVWEMPAGLKDKEGEEGTMTAARELWEETGFVGGDGVVLYDAPTSPGMSNETVEFVRVANCEKKGTGGGIPGEEEIEVAVVEPSQVADFLEKARERGDLVDARIYMALWVIGTESARVQGFNELRDEMVAGARGEQKTPKHAGEASRTPGAKIKS